MAFIKGPEYFRKKYIGIVKGYLFALGDLPERNEDEDGGAAMIDAWKGILERSASWDEDKKLAARVGITYQAILKNRKKFNLPLRRVGSDSLPEKRNKKWSVANRRRDFLIRLGIDVSGLSIEGVLDRWKVVLLADNTWRGDLMLSGACGANLSTIRHDRRVMGLLEGRRSCDRDRLDEKEEGGSQNNEGAGKGDGDDDDSHPAPLRWACHRLVSCMRGVKQCIRYDECLNEHLDVGWRDDKPFAEFIRCGGVVKNGRVVRNSDCWRG